MKRRAIVTFALLASLLVVTAVPAAASHGLAVASSHTTDTDFNGADTLENVTVEESGSAAFVEFESGTDGFEDGDIIEYTAKGTNTDNWDAVQSDAKAGSWSLEYDGTGNSERALLERESIAGNNITIESWIKLDAGMRSGFAFTDNVGTTGFEFQVREDQNDILIFDRGNTTTLDSASVTINSGEYLYIAIQYDGSTATFFVDNDTDYEDAPLANVSGSLGADGLGYGLYDDGSGSNTAHWDDFFTDQIGGDPGTYISQTHSADDVEQGFTNLTLTNVSATVTWLADTDGDGIFETEAATSSFTTTGNKTLDLSGTDSTDWRVNVTFEETGGSPVGELHDEGVLFNASDPIVDNSSATPTGELETATPTLEIDINDTDFDLAQGDSVEVEFFVDGSSVGTDTLTSNGTASVETSELTGGDSTWNATATDDYGHSVTSQDFTITVPANLTIREESPEHPIVKPTEVSVKFFEQTNADPTVVNRTTTDGNISLEGLPIGSAFSVTISAPGYHNRTVVINDIFTQANVFLLNTSEDSVDVLFTIEDLTGDFAGEETEITIQRAINESLYNDTGGFSFMTIEGDQVGAAGQVRVTLQQDERYRIRVANDEETRILGGYTAETSETVTLRPSLPGVNVTDEEGYAWNATTTVDGGTITFEFLDPDDDTTDLQLIIHEQNNASNELYNQTHAGPHGYLKVTQVLTDAQANETWVVKYSATRGGEEIGGQTGVGRQVVTQLPQLDDTWKHAVAVIITIMTGALFGVRNAETGAVTTAFIGGGFWMSGWLPNAAGGAILVGLVVAVLWKTQTGRFG